MQEEKESDLEKYSRLWNGVYGGEKLRFGNFLNSWKEKNKKEDKEYGIFILQEHKLIGQKWRIIYCRDKQWKELYHSNSWNEIEKRFNDYIKMLEWKKQQQ